MKFLEDAMVKKEETSQEMLLKRLKRIEGQVRGIEKMIVDGRDCESLVTQLAAVRSAIESAGALVLNNYMKICFRKDGETESASIDSLARVVAIWGRVRVGDQA
jgi:DNA-binding FrmR family transcriptional regulator